MGDTDPASDLVSSSQERVTVKVGSCKGLHGTKGPHLTSVVKVEYGSNVIGESSKVDADVNQTTTDYNYVCQFNVLKNDPYSLDDIAHSPLVLTIIEILPKDKKSREEKTHVLGQSCVDLHPLLKGHTDFTATRQIYASGPIATISLNTESPHGPPQPVGEIEVSIHTANPVLSQELLDASNMMSVCLESMYAVPETWIVNGPQYIYSAGLSVPINEQKESTVLLPNGSYRAAGEKEVTNQKKWPSAANAMGACMYIPNTTVTKKAYEFEDGELKSKEDFPFRLEAESERPSINWNAERRCFLNPAAAESLQYKIAQYRVWPVEVSRTLMPVMTKAKGKIEEDTSMTHHGVAYVDFSPLLYPGVQKIRGAYLVHPFSESELLSKTSKKPVLTDETSKVIGGMARSIASSMGIVKQAPTKLGKAEMRQKPSAAVLKPPDASSEGDNTDSKNSEAQQYVDARTYMIIEITLDKPLVPKKQIEALTQRVAELIPARPKFPKKIGGAKKAVNDFQSQIARTAKLLLEEFRYMFGDDVERSDGSGPEERRKQFLYELNSSGKYFAFKEQMKYYIIKLVREKFMNTTGFQSQEEMQAFISELYQFLVDQMHMGLNKYLDSEETVEIPPPVTNSEMLKHFAMEAEAEFNFEIAAKYYQERITRDKNDPKHWLDYGVFCLLIDDVSKAEECFKEVVAIDQKHINGLVLNGCIAMMQEDFEAAEILFEAATAVDQESVMAWTMLGLYYAGMDNNILSERAFNEAERLNNIKNGDVDQRKSYVQLEGDPEISDIEEQAKTDERPGLAQLDLAAEVIPETDYNISGVADTVKDRPHSATDDALLKGVETLSTSTTLHDESPHSDKKADQTSIYLEAARFLLDSHILQMAERALALDLLLSCGEHSAAYFELLACFKIEKKEFQDAKEAIDKALVIKHQNPTAWSLMAHLYFLSGEYQEAKKCYERTLAYVGDPVNVHLIYLRLAKIYWIDQEYTKAKQIYLRASINGPSCISWLGVGKSAYKLNELVEAEHALKEANALDNKNSEVWAYLTLVCLKSGRHLEAEQSYKFAMKAGLENDDLVNEIMTTMDLAGFDKSVL